MRGTGGSRTIFCGGATSATASCSVTILTAGQVAAKSQGVRGHLWPTRHSGSDMGKTKHGLHVGGRHPLYARWCQVKARCQNPNCDRYPYYGKRGIRLCERWQQFENFVQDMGQSFFSGATLERKDNSGPYSPENCIWTDWTTQQNNKRNNRYITFRGQKLSVSQWAKKLGCFHARLTYRMNSGKTIEQVMSNKDFRSTERLLK